MKNAASILIIAVFALSACARTRNQTPPKGNRDNTAFSWLSTTSVPQPVAR